MPGITPPAATRDAWICRHAGRKNRPLLTLPTHFPIAQGCGIGLNILPVTRSLAIFAAIVCVPALLAAQPAPAAAAPAPPPAPVENPAPAAVGEGTDPAAAPAQASPPAETPPRQAPPVAQPPAVPPPAAQPPVAPPGSEPEARPAKPVAAATPPVHGYVEWVEVGNPAVRCKAKLDTGAKTSSIHAEKATLFERDGAKWVRFLVVAHDQEKRVQFEEALVRVARIKVPNGESQERYVVNLDLLLGEKRLRKEFTLNERSNMIYPVLLGRSALKSLGPVDAGRAFVVTPRAP
jgi:hypothetical protein